MTEKEHEVGVRVRLRVPRTVIADLDGREGVIVEVDRGAPYPIRVQVDGARSIWLMAEEAERTHA